MSQQVIVIGGGPSGLMAAIAAADAGASVLLLDKGEALGRKLAISGGGRCNVTNAKDIDELIRFIPGNGRFLYSALSSFGNRQIIDFFTALGIALKEEDHGRMFPVSDKAKTVVDALLAKVRALGVNIRTSCAVKQLLMSELPLDVNRFAGNHVHGVLTEDDETLQAKAVIIATGGCSVPHTGSTGDGYPWARAAGHTITELFPTEVPITVLDSFVRDRTLQGLSLRNIALTVWSPKAKKVKTHEGDLIFTHLGLSGPAALRCSQYVVKTLKTFACSEIKLTIDLVPPCHANEVEQTLRSTAKRESKKALKNVLKACFSEWQLPERLIPTLLGLCQIDGELTAPQISNNAWQTLTLYIKQFPLHANGTLSLSEAFITGGGVSIKEIDPRTMASQLAAGLYFCGEVMDIHGYTGGYNITAAFASGHCAGRSAAQFAISEANPL